MGIINEFLAEKGIYILTFTLFAIGVYGLATCHNYIKKLMAMNIMLIALIFFFLVLGQNLNTHGSLFIRKSAPDDYHIEPVTHALMLTSVVVSLGINGVGLALLMSIRKKYGTFDEEKIFSKGI